MKHWNGYISSEYSSIQYFDLLGCGLDCTAQVEIGLSDKTHHEQTEDLQEWVNTYAWAATDETTSKQEDETEESELDDDSKADS